jgi:hypothetical protein
LFFFLKKIKIKNWEKIENNEWFFIENIVYSFQNSCSSNCFRGIDIPLLKRIVIPMRITIPINRLQPNKIMTIYSLFILMVYSANQTRHKTKRITLPL